MYQTQKKNEDIALQRKKLNGNGMNATGIPLQMKKQIEAMSGLPLDDVRVHYNSDRPAQFQALAYTQGNQVYVGPGQEKHLSHELGHVVQQKRGMVRPTTHINGLTVNDDPALEREADLVGSRANLPGNTFQVNDYPTSKYPYSNLIQRVEIGIEELDTDDPDSIRAYIHANIENFSLIKTLLEALINIGAVDLAKELIMDYVDANILNASLIKKLRDTLNEIEDIDLDHEIDGLVEIGKTLYNEILNPKKPEQKKTMRKKLIRKKPKIEEQTMPDPEKPVGKDISFKGLELAYANLAYEQGSMMKIPSMRDFVKRPLPSDQSYIDIARRSFIERESDVLRDGWTGQSRENLLLKLMPRLIELSKHIRLAHYFNEVSEDAILKSGKLLSKKRLQLMAGHTPVNSRSTSLDDELGNTDHVFFFAEYEEDGHPAPFRETRFTGIPSPDGTAMEKPPGTGRRASFPLNKAYEPGTHGYLQDQYSKQGGLNVVDNTFSGMPMNEEQEREADSKTPGVHLLMDLLRQRFKQKSFSQTLVKNKKAVGCAKYLEGLNDYDLFTFLFRGNERCTQVNPQILIPGSVSLRDVRFDKEPVPEEE